MLFHKTRRILWHPVDNYDGFAACCSYGNILNGQFRVCVRSVGLNKGFLVHKRVVPTRPSRRKGKKSARVQAIREVIRQVAGFAPYERRMLDLIKIGTAATTKRALKFAKKRLGTHKRGKAKREELTEVAAAMKRKAQA